MNTTNIVTAVISDSNFTVASPILKEDKGMRLKIKGAVLPATYEVDFSLNRERGESVTMIGDGQGVEIPEYLIKTGKDIYEQITVQGVVFRHRSVQRSSGRRRGSGDH